MTAATPELATVPAGPGPATTSATGSTTRRRLPIAWYPTLLAVALIVELINVGGTSPFAATRPMILAIVGGILLAALGRLVLGDRDRGGVLAALWVLALLGSEDLRLTFAIAAATVLLLLERYALPPAQPDHPLVAHRPDRRTDRHRPLRRRRDPGGAD